jgi:hypothetical protein
MKTAQFLKRRNSLNQITESVKQKNLNPNPSNSRNGYFTCRACAKAQNLPAYRRSLNSTRWGIQPAAIKQWQRLPLRVQRVQSVVDAFNGKNRYTKAKPALWLPNPMWIRRL